MPDDYSADIQTTGVVTVGGIATGTIDSAGDRDWFAVELVAGRTYTIDLRGSPTNDGTLSDPYLRGIHDADGTLIAGTTDDDGGEGYNSRLTFTATESGAYYIAAGAYSSRQGTYELEVTDTTPPPDDFADTAATTGVIEVGGSVTGQIGEAGDFDWFALDVIAGRIYVIDLEGSETDAGTLENPQLRGLFDADDNRLPGTTWDADGGEGLNSRMTWTATETGTVYVVARGHRDDTGTYRLSVTDISPQAQQQETVNAAPAFGQESYSFDLAENADGALFGIELGPVVASDADNDPITYSIVGGDPDGLFYIEAETGFLLYVGTGEDYESGPASYELTVRASDGTAHSDVAVTVSVNDVEDDAISEQEANQAPQFTSASYAFALDENVAGVPVPLALGLVQATDSDDDQIEYSIESGDPDALFAIDSATGALSYVGTGEDYESGTTSHELTVRASDGTAHSDVTVTVSVSDLEDYVVSEQTANQAPQFTYGSYAFSLPENAAGDTVPLALGLVQATDPNDDPVEYSIEGGNAAGLFAIDSTTGALSYVGAGEDYEAGVTQFELTLRASDGSLHSDATVTVNVTDVPEQAIVEPPVPATLPGVSEPDGADLPTDTSTSGRVVAGDGPVTGTIGRSGDRDGFAVELVAGRTYVIDLRGSPTDDGTLRDPYLRGIKGPDGTRIAGVSDDDGGTGYNSRLEFTPEETGTHYIIAGAYSSRQGTYELEVTDISPPAQQQETVNAAPAFGQASYEFSLAENEDGSPNRISLGTVAAADPDNDPVTYSIVGGDPDGLFLIEAGTGFLLYVGTGEDYESGPANYELTVRASDGTAHSDVTVTVNVTDVAESVSELAGEDLPDDTTTTGRAVVGDTVSGEVGAYFDTDWFAVDLVAGRTYVIDLRGNGTGDGSLRDPKLKGVYDSDGTWISGQRDDDGGDGLNSRLTITATETATHYIGAGAHLTGLGTYELEVTDTTGDTATVDPVDDFAAESTTTGVLVPDTDTGVALAYGDIDSGGDVDWFAIELEANQSVVLRLTGYNPETRSYDGGIENPQIKGIYDSDENLLPGSSTSDPHAYQLFGSGSRILEIGTYGGGPQEARLVFRATEAGTYYVAAGSLYAAETGKFTLAASPGPVADDFSDDTTTSGEVTVGGSVQGNIEWEDDADWFAVELTAGVRYEFGLAGPEDSREYPVFGRYIWDGHGNPYASWRSGTDSVVDPGNTIDHGFFTPLNSGTYYIPVSGGSYDSFWAGNNILNEYWDEALPYTLTVAEADEQPPADDFTADTSTSGELEVDGVAVSGEIEVAGDVDWLAVDLVAGKTYVFVQRGSFRSDENTLRSPKIVAVYDSDGNAIADTGSSYRSDGIDGARVAYKASETGTHYVAVGSDGWTTATRVGTYTIEAQEIASDSVPADSTTTQTMGVRTVWFEVNLDASKHYIVTVGEADGGSDVQPFKVAAYDADGTEIDTFDGVTTADTVSLTASISSSFHDGGTHYVAVTTTADNDSAAYEAEAHEVTTAHTSTVTIIGTQDITQLDEAPIWAGEVLRQWATGVIETVDDVDWIAVDLEEGQTYEFRTEDLYPFGSYPGGEFGTFELEGLYDANGQRVAAGESPSLSYEAVADGTHYVAVAGGDHSGLGHYRVLVEEQPDAI